MEAEEKAKAEAEAAPAPRAKEKLADLKHPDAKHLLLGINLEGLREACELVGFPFRCYKDGWRDDAWAPSGYCTNYKYKRENHPEMAWLDEAYPDSGEDSWFLGYDFCCAVKTWLKANGHENESICQVLLKRGSKNVRPANVFYSHIQGVWLPETIKRMREGIEAHKAALPSTDESQLFFWLDYTTLKQCVHDFDLNRVRQLIKEIGLTLAELDIDPQAYLTRSFLHSRASGHRPGRRQTARADELSQGVWRGGRARDKAGRRQGGADAQGEGQGVDGYVEAMPGGFNATITEAIKKAAAVIVEQYSDSKIHLDAKGLTAHDATVVAEILKSNTSVTTVNLYGNKAIGDEGAKALAKALKVNTTLEELWLVDCGIGDKGAAALAKALRSNTSLTTLHLYDNHGKGIGKQKKQLLRDAVADRPEFWLVL